MKLSDIKNDNDIEEYYNKCRKIKFNDNDKINTRLDIIKYLSENKKNTYYVRNSLHCYSYKWRSVSDYVILCKYYFPKFSVKNNIKFLFNFICKEGNHIRPRMNYCGNIGKTNFQSNVSYSTMKYVNTIYLSRYVKLNKQLELIK